MKESVLDHASIQYIRELPIIAVRTTVPICNTRITTLKIVTAVLQSTLTQAHLIKVTITTIVYRAVPV